MKNVHQGGFSLIEVLITLVVLAVGLVALAKFQGTTIESGSLAKERAVAAHLAQQKLDDLRDYERLIKTDAAGAAIACNADASVSYRCIATDAGGNKNADFTLILPSGDPSVGIVPPPNWNVTYNRTWTVTDWCFPGTAAGDPNHPGKKPNVPADESSCTAQAPTFPDFKRVTVTVTWMDLEKRKKGQADAVQTVVLRSIISASDPLYSGRVLE